MKQSLLLIFVGLIVASCATESTPSYTLTLEIVGSGTTTPAPGRYVFDKGEVFQLTAVPDPGWYFDRWEGVATGAMAQNPYENDIYSDLDVRAIFLKSPISRAANGITIQCAGSAVGAKGWVDGIEYVVVDREWIIQNRRSADMTKVCVSNVTDMSNLFDGSAGLRFNQPIGNWDVSNVNNMKAMFLDSQFNQDISKWDVRNVVDMQAMFWNSPFNKPIGDWNVSAVENMTQMFGRSSFNQPINRWCVTKIKTEPFEFALIAPLSASNKPVWGTCPAS